MIRNVPEVGNLDHRDKSKSEKGSARTVIAITKEMKAALSPEQLSILEGRFTLDWIDESFPNDSERRHAVDIFLVSAHQSPEILKQLQNVKERHQPILCVSTTKSAEGIEELFAHGADDVLRGPYEGKELLLRIEHLIATNKQRTQLEEQIDNSREVIETLRELQRFREDMIGLAVHDLKNPLTVITTNLSYALEEIRPLSKDNVSEALLDAKSGTNNLLRLLSNLLDVVRFEAGRLELDLQPISISDLFQKLCREHKRAAMEKNIQLKATAEPGILVNVDRDLIYRVLENLLVNALRYTRSGGNILMDCMVVEESCDFSVRNDGPPIRTESWVNLFKKFEGTGVRKANVVANLGLGLYFCRLAVEAHGGSIKIEQSEKWPVSFEITMPKSASQIK